MKTNLVEGQFGHGGRYHPLQRAIQRFWRRLKGKQIKANAGSNFDWSTGIDTIQKIGGIKIKNQGQNYSCGRQAGAYGQYILRRLEGINEGEISAKSGYGQYCARGGGMSASDIETDIGAWGANLEKDVPSYDIYGNPLPEYLMEETSWANPTLITDAFTRAGYTPFDVAIDRDSIALAVQNYGFIIWIIEGQNNGTWLSDNPRPPSYQNPNPLWRHWMCVPITGLKNGVPTITALNSWGESVGRKGYQDFTDYIESGHILECIAFVKDTKIVPAPDNTSIWAAIWAWFHSPWLLPSLSN